MTHGPSDTGLVVPLHSRRRKRALAVDHLVGSGRPFRRFTARWADITQITVTDRQAKVRTHDGRRRRISLSDLENAEQIREALMHAQKRLEPAAS